VFKHQIDGVFTDCSGLGTGGRQEGVEHLLSSVFNPDLASPASGGSFVNRDGVMGVQSFGAPNRCKEAVEVMALNGHRAVNDHSSQRVCKQLALLTFDNGLSAIYLIRKPG